MSTATGTANVTGVESGNWKAGVVGGILGALAMGILVLLMNQATIAVAIPSLYGFAPPASVGAGLFVHLSHGAVLGVAFAAVVGILGPDSTGRVVGLGAGWGVVTWFVLAGLIMPLWLSTVGSPASPPFPNFAIPSLLWHLVYGVVLGAVYPAVEGKL